MVTKMFFILALICCGIVDAHYKNGPKIRKLKAGIEEIKSTQDDIFLAIDEIETNVTLRLQGIVGGPVVSTKAVDDLDLENFESRLSILEGTVDALKTYLAEEKRKDRRLRIRAEEAIGKINEKVLEAELLVDSTRESISQSVVGFEDELKSLNEAANRNTNIEGVIFYGGVGTSCSVGNDACIVSDSECRGGRCQCKPGYSYNKHTKECVTTCNKYGKTFQSVDNYVIRGHNDNVEEDKSLAECKKLCLTAEDFECRSYEYFKRWRHCYLSSETKLDAEDAWEYNSVGQHFQRDCD